MQIKGIYLYVFNKLINFNLKTIWYFILVPLHIVLHISSASFLLSYEVSYSIFSIKKF